MDYSILKTIPLFQNLSETELVKLKNCTKMHSKNYVKDELILNAGDTVDKIGIILSGKLVIEHYDLLGNPNIIQIIGKHKVFGESYALLKDKKMLFNVRALEDSEIFFIELASILNSCPGDCSVFQKIQKKLLEILAQKNYEMNQKIVHTSAKSIRSKVISFLSFESKKMDSTSFEIQFNRQQLADFLNVDRSALSKELSVMKKEGLIDYQKNRFDLLVK